MKIRLVNDGFNSLSEILVEDALMEMEENLEDDEELNYEEIVDTVCWVSVRFQNDELVIIYEYDLSIIYDSDEPRVNEEDVIEFVEKLKEMNQDDLPKEWFTGELITLEDSVIFEIIG